MDTRVEPKLAITFCGMPFNTPLVLLSQVAWGSASEYTRVAGFSNRDVGAICLEGTTGQARLGNPPHRITETPDGMLNALGLQNPGVEAVCRDILPKLDFSETRFIANVCGSTLEEYVEVAARFDDSPIDAMEINISCPNVKEGGVQFGNVPEMSARVVAAIRKVTKKPLITKDEPRRRVHQPDHQGVTSRSYAEHPGDLAARDEELIRLAHCLCRLDRLSFPVRFLLLLHPQRRHSIDDDAVPVRTGGPARRRARHREPKLLRDDERGAPLHDPDLTMGLFSEEKKRGTMELLLTTPVGLIQTMMGKYLASLTFLVIMFLASGITISALFIYGQPEWKIIAGGFLGLLLYGAALLALGLFISTLTENQIISVVITFGTILVLWLIESFSAGASGVAKIFDNDSESYESLW